MDIYSTPFSYYLDIYSTILYNLFLQRYIIISIVFISLVLLFDKVLLCLGYEGIFINESDNNDTYEKEYPIISLGDRMKEYEQKSKLITNVKPDESFIIRLDGRSFSKKTKQLKNSAKEAGMIYSVEFANAMRLTSCDLLTEFKPTTAYSHSDEITLIFPAVMTTENYENKVPPVSEHEFNGKVFKLLTLIASFTSVRFTYNLKNQLEKSQSSCYEYYFGNNWNTLTFDARIMTFPKEKQNGEILNHMVWRSKQDCYRNFVSMFAENHFSQKIMDGMSTKHRVDKLKEEKGVDLTINDNIDMKYGVYVKKMQHKDHDQSQSKIIYFSLPELQYTDDYINLLINKTYDEANTCKIVQCVV
jgi:tRNA(His) 5'-end guanylyltransferase